MILLGGGLFEGAYLVMGTYSRIFRYIEDIEKPFLRNIEKAFLNIEIDSSVCD